MVIKTYKELKSVLNEEKINYFNRRLRFPDEIRLAFEKNRIYRIWKLQKHMRILEYLKSKNGFFNHIILRCVRRKFNCLCEALNIEIYPGIFGKGLIIYHGGIVVNTKAVIGENCILHGNNCVGNAGTRDFSTPVLGNDVDIGFGSSIIGGVSLADNIIVAAGAVVNKSFLEPNVIIAGIPAKYIKHNNQN